MYLMFYIDEEGNRVYTLEKVAENNQATVSAHPARFSPEDRYSRERILMKKRYNLLPDGVSSINAGDGDQQNHQQQTAQQPPVKPPTFARRSNPCDLLKNLKSVDKKHQKKPTILEQAAQDWNKSKAEENLVDELSQATKSKTGYLDRQEFLQRADVRQFEQEKQIRDKIRSRQSSNK